MERRSFIKSSLLTSAALLAGSSWLKAETLSSKMKITAVRFYLPPVNNRQLFNQSRAIIEVETDGGIIGIGEGGGSKDLIEQCAKMMIGQDPFQIENIWQLLYRGVFYPPGREKLHAMGGLEMALWDIKGKALNVPVYELLGGSTRQFVECYCTTFTGSKATTEAGRAVDALASGLRVYRLHPEGDGAPYDFYASANKTIELCKSVFDAVGPGGKWAVDLHTRFDTADAIRICDKIADMEPFFVEDLVRSENKGLYKTIRPMVKVPIAVGEQFGDRWDINELLENNLIDYSRVTLPNTGGIGEFRKIANMCETHYQGMIPHFTGPVSTAALVHVIGSLPVRAMMELLGGYPEKPAYLDEGYVDFRNGKLYLKNDPGLGVKFNKKTMTLALEVKEKIAVAHPLLYRPDGSINNW